MTNIENNAEIWLPVVNYETLYEISSKGNLRSLDKYVNTGIRHVKKVKRKGKDIILKNHPSGYKFIFLYKNGIGKMSLIHRLVALAFIPNIQNKKSVNHKDGIRSNNVVENLEWVTPKENSEHAVKMGKYYVGEQVHLTKLTAKIVTEIREKKGTITGKQLAKEIGISSTNIYDIWNRKIWKHIP